MSKLDWKKDLKYLYGGAVGKMAIVDVPPMNYLMIDGKGDPNHSPAYQEAVEALYSLSYTLKFALKKDGTEYSVMPLEGLWWAESMLDFSLGKKENWLWTMMIAQPECVTAAHVDETQTALVTKKGLAALDKVRFETYHEGTAVQVMYVGAYADEGPTIAALHAFARENGFELFGKHHEIYLGDPRRTAPEKLKTVIRQPVRKTG